MLSWRKHGLSVLAAADDADVDADVDAVSDAASSGAAGATVSEAHASSHLMPRSADSGTSASSGGLRSRSTSLGAPAPLGAAGGAAPTAIADIRPFVGA